MLGLNLVASDLEPSWTLVSDRAAQQGIVKTLAMADRGTGAHLHRRADRIWDGSGACTEPHPEERADASAALVKAARDARSAFGDVSHNSWEKRWGSSPPLPRSWASTLAPKAKALLDSHSVSFGKAPSPAQRKRYPASRPGRRFHAPARRRPAAQGGRSGVNRSARTNWSTGWSRTASRGSWAPSAPRRPLLRCRCSSPPIHLVLRTVGGQLFVLRRGHQGQ